MAELLTLTTPVIPSVSSTTAYRLCRLVIDHDRVGNGSIAAFIRDNNGAGREIVWRDTAGEPATSLIIALNKANLSVKSLERRVLEQAVADGKLGAGTVTGSPD